ncbi:MAG TPA: leucine--tRNA ligase [Ignavibacteria bacterium]|nr:leucine--tRNA ligase [Ignavibacteria bacterium]
MKYNHIEIEKKWQRYWKENKTFRTPEFDELDLTKPKYYVLDMFPYPSGDGLHVGHAEGYTATDIIARYKRMRGFNVLHPMGWDAFGLPTEQFAIKTGIHPKIRTEECIARFKQQLNSIGFGYDWEREVNTSDKDFFRWTQWIFLKLFNSYYDIEEDKAKPIEDLKIPDGLSDEQIYNFINNQRLAYLADGPVNWCPELGTVLANEEVAEQIEKGFTVVRKNMKQWKLRITSYADRLLNDLNNLDWPDNIKEIQKNWIGRSEGAIIKFKIKSEKLSELGVIEVFTTRPDTLFGATFLVIAPEHPVVKNITSDENKSEIEKYIDESSKKSELERIELNKIKSGVFTGAFAINPANGKEIPIYISDYVLMSYGTGSIMSVPGHDERDMEFAKKYNIDIEPVVIPEDLKDSAIRKLKTEESGELILTGRGLKTIGFEDSFEYKDYIRKVTDGEICYYKEGYAINSGFLNGLATKEAKVKVTEWLSDNNLGYKTINYRLRDWLFSRQRFWGEPFPILHSNDGKIKALLYDEIPLELPEVENYKPSGTGESPLANISDWVNIESPSGIKYKRETNTMPQLAGSSWYFLRYIDPGNKNNFCDIEKEKYWMPVDTYIGGAEHSVGHLLYARFWMKFLFDLGLVTHNEPFRKLFNQGMVLGEDGVKMSKSRGNVVNPEDVIKDFGADSLRLFEMFMGPLETSKPWSTEGIAGMNRFLNRVWRLIIDEDSDNINTKIIDVDPSEKETRILHRTIKKITNDLDDGDMKFNTSIAQMMIFINELYKMETLSKKTIQDFILLLSPFAPHISEEIWFRIGNPAGISDQSWPKFIDEFTKQETVTVAFSVNGKVRAKIEMDFDADEKSLEQTALDNESIKKHIYGKNIKKIITVRNKMVNVVVS